jgi:hypothetical protein
MNEYKAFTIFKRNTLYYTNKPHYKCVYNGKIITGNDTAVIVKKLMKMRW